MPMSSAASCSSKSAADLLNIAEELEIENASTMRKGELMFAILKEMAEEGAEVSGDGQFAGRLDGDGFAGFERVGVEVGCLGEVEGRGRELADASRCP